MKETIDISIKIADVKPIALTVKRQDEAFVRQVVYDVNNLYRTLDQRYGASRSSKELLAMALYHFAKGYKSLQLTASQTDEALKDFEGDLDQVLLDVG